MNARKVFITLHSDKKLMKKIMPEYLLIARTDILDTKR